MFYVETPWGNRLAHRDQAPSNKLNKPRASAPAVQSERLWSAAFVQVLAHLVQQRAECFRAWVNQFEMLDILEQLQCTVVAHLDGTYMVSLTDAMGHRGITGAMYQRMGQAQRQHLDGRAFGVSIGHLLAGAAQELHHNLFAEAEARALGKVHGAGQRYSPNQWQRLVSVKRAAFFQGMAPRRPQRKLPSCGEPHRQYPLNIQPVTRRDFTKKVDRTAHVGECPGPATTFFPNTPVLNVPGREARHSKRGTEVRMRLQPMSGTPPSPMDSHNNGIGAVAVR